MISDRSLSHFHHSLQKIKTVARVAIKIKLPEIEDMRGKIGVIWKIAVIFRPLNYGAPIAERRRYTIYHFPKITIL